MTSKVSELAIWIEHRLRERISPRLCIARKISPKSHSVYLYVSDIEKGVGIRISDHMGKSIPRRAIEFYTRKENVRDFYFYTEQRSTQIEQNTLSNIVKFFQE